MGRTRRDSSGKFIWYRPNPFWEQKQHHVPKTQLHDSTSNGQFNNMGVHVQYMYLLFPNLFRSGTDEPALISQGVCPSELDRSEEARRPRPRDGGARRREKSIDTIYYYFSWLLLLWVFVLVVVVVVLSLLRGVACLVGVVQGFQGYGLSIRRIIQLPCPSNDLSVMFLVV